MARKTNKKNNSAKTVSKLDLIKEIAVSTSSNKKRVNDNKKLSSEETKYVLTPKGILYLVLSEAFKQSKSKDISSNDLIDDFTQELLTRLSLLATNGEDSKLFGSDFNEFFSMFINSMNLCGYLKDKLEENGIEFDKDDYENGLNGMM